jgi:hypothetical protein
VVKTYDTDGDRALNTLEFLRIIKPRIFYEHGENTEEQSSERQEASLEEVLVKLLSLEIEFHRVSENLK